MKNKFKSIFIVLLLLMFFLAIIVFSNDVVDSVIFSISIWKDTLIPSLFPFFLVADLLIEYGFIDFISLFMKKIMNKFFYLPKEASFAFTVSMFSGFPSGAKYTKDLLNRNLISLDDANHLIMFTHFSNPLFVISTIGVLLLNNKSYGLLILLSHILANIIVGFIFRKKSKININLEHVLTKKEKNNNFINILTNSIFNNLKTLVMLFGIITFFLIITTIVNKVITLPFLFDCIFSGILEMTQGVQKLSTLTGINLNLKLALIAMIISFGGISVHFQVLSIINDTKIKYKYYLKARIFHAIIAFLLVFIMSSLI